MKIRTLFKLAAVGSLLAAGSVMAQDASRPQEPGRPMLCPHPTGETLVASGSSLFAGDVNATVTSNMTGLASPVLNKHHPYTFRWKSPACCKIMGATLTITLKAISAGTSNTSSDAGNDMIGIYHNGAGLPGVGGYIFPNSPFPAGTTVTRTFNLTPAQIATLNLDGDNRLTFNTQDDTMVTSAKLVLNRCCIK
ncbi:MAG: hypothetical protein Q7T19_12940 [Caulobacter sp.]|nr:hypothetical protein [Caulobacter sp.]